MWHCQMNLQVIIILYDTIINWKNPWSKHDQAKIQEAKKLKPEFVLQQNWFIEFELHFHLEEREDNNRKQDKRTNLLFECNIFLVVVMVVVVTVTDFSLDSIWIKWWIVDFSRTNKLNCVDEPLSWIRPVHTTKFCNFN